ncbi:MAG: 6,7-dimethyl-8-ribityllumazine synthase [Bdellovibrionales bacterium]|nr:6,7-dimethyl-8-ribityllumazine synthase [Bdellovibrionales bacterium]
MNITQADLNITGIKKIGVVTARFNAPVTEKLEQGAFEKLNTLGFKEEQVIAVRVPGAVEIPLAVQALLEQGCDGVVALGAVIRGETAHFDYVCNSVERACTQLQLDFKKPVGFGVLTTENAEQAYARSGGAKGNKGAETVEVVIEMINLTKTLTQTP